MAKWLLPRLSCAVLLSCLGLAANGAQATIATSPIMEWCAHLSKELLSVNHERCVNRPWKFDTQSKQGHPIPYLDFGTQSSDTPTNKTSRRILVLGAIHGDEISAVSLVFRWIDFIDREPADSPLRKAHYVFYPLVNPDGFYVKPRTRPNSNGVDLNRNFETKDWDRQAHVFWKKKTGSDKRRYPGDRAGSEVETKAVQKAVDEFKPDLIVSVHAPYKVLDHDGPLTFPKSGSPLPIRTLGAFPGSLGTYAGLERHTPVVTPELPSATQLPDVKIVEQLLLFIMKSKF